MLVSRYVPISDVYVYVFNRMFAHPWPYRPYPLLRTKLFEQEAVQEAPLVRYRRD